MAAVSARAAWGIFRYIQAGGFAPLEFPDEQQYWLMASSLAAGEGLRDELGFVATRMPLYPAFVAVFTGLPGGLAMARCMHWVLGAVVAVLTARLGAAVAHSTGGRLDPRQVGLLAGLIVAIDPFLIFFSSLLLTETPFMAGLVGLLILIRRASTPDAGTADSNRAPALDAGSRPRRGFPVSGVPCRGSPGVRTGLWVAIGACGALCVYLRESGLGLTFLLLLFAAVVPRFDVRRFKGAALAGLIVVTALVPWAVRNRTATGEWVWLTTRGGISLYDGVGPQATGASDLGDVKQSPAVANLSETEWNRHFLEASWRAIRAEPERIAGLALTKLKRMWSPVPNAEDYRSGLFRLVSAAWTIPVYALALIGAIILCRRGSTADPAGESGLRCLDDDPLTHGVRAGWRTVILLLLPAIYLTALHSLFVGSVRYRLGAMPMIEILVAVALAAGVARAQRRWNPPAGS